MADETDTTNSSNSTSLYSYLTDTGVIVPTTDKLKEQTETEIKQYWFGGADVDFTNTTIVGRIVEYLVSLKTAILGVNARHANQININYATGQYLDALGANWSIDRKFATPTVVVCKLQGTPGTIIPAGTIVKSNHDGREYSLTKRVYIQENGVVDGIFECKETGAIQCPSNSITIKGTDIEGWDTVNNENTGTIGYDIENDERYRKRIKDSIWKGSSFLPNIKSKLLAISGMRSCFVYDNNSNTSINYYGTVIPVPQGEERVPIPAHSVLIICECSGRNDEIAKAIVESISPGCGMTGLQDQSDTGTYIDPDFGVSYTVTFNRPLPVPFNIHAEILTNKSPLGRSELKAAIIEAVQTWAKGEDPYVEDIQLGADVSAFEVAASISDSLPDIKIKRVYFKKLEYDEDTHEWVEAGDPLTELSIDINQIAKLEEIFPKVDDEIDSE